MAGVTHKEICDLFEPLAGMVPRESQFAKEGGLTFVPLRASPTKTRIQSPPSPMQGVVHNLDQCVQERMPAPYRKTLENEGTAGKTLISASGMLS